MTMRMTRLAFITGGFFGGFFGLREKLARYEIHSHGRTFLSPRDALVRFVSDLVIFLDLSCFMYSVLCCTFFLKFKEADLIENEFILQFGNKS